MCTVTYIPSGSSFYFTSNRDEKKTRLKAEPPHWHQFASGKLLFPKDGNAGGTWMALHENGNAMILLNGGLVNHQHVPPYRKSRGLIFLDVFDHPQPLTAFEKICLQKIEPFTLIIRQQQQLFETKWDGIAKSIIELNSKEPKIWSSVTLYSATAINKRNEWFQAFIKNNTGINSGNILNFHHFAGDGDSTNDIKMNRMNQLFTVSITLLHQKNKHSTFHYFDLLTNETHIEEADHIIPATIIHESA